MNTATETKKQVRHEDIAQRARQIWEREGHQAGHDVEYWLRAERELFSGGSQSARTQPDPVPAGAKAQGTRQSAQGRPSSTRILHI